MRPKAVRIGGENENFGNCICYVCGDIFFRVCRIQLCRLPRLAWILLCRRRKWEAVRKGHGRQVLEVEWEWL